MALQAKMAAPAHSRNSERAATQESPTSQEIPPSREACISIRLWTASGAAEPGSSLWESENPVACLIFDLIAASGGHQVSRQDEVLMAGFSSFQSAILAARRLQWAVQGFSEGGDSQTASLAVLVFSPKDISGQAADGNLPHPSELAAVREGEILLTAEASRALENLPGFPLQEAASGGGLRELLWRVPEDKSTRSFDEEILSQLVELHGVQIQAPEEPEPPAASEEDFVEDDGAESPAALPSEPSHGNSRWVIGGAVIAALVLVAVVLLYLSLGKSTPAPDQTPAQTSPQQAPAEAPAAQAGQPASGSPAHPAAADRAATQAKAAKNGQKGSAKPSEQPAAQTPQPEKPPPAKPQPEAQKGRCDLDPSQYSGQIDQAWKNLGRGKYNDAKREFSAVLACDPGNGRAKEGLDRARMAASDADGQPEN